MVSSMLGRGREDQQEIEAAEVEHVGGTVHHEDPSMTALPSSVLVTGCGGFIGGRTARLLLDVGVQVVGIDCLLPHLYPAQDKARRVASLSTVPGFTFHELDLRHDDLSAAVGTTEVVLHFAAMAGLRPSWSDPALYASHNVSGTERLLDAMEAAGAASHLVHASTSSVYGTRAVGDESTVLDPASPYGETKLEAERLVADRVTAGAITATVLRYFSVYGPDQRPDMAYAAVIRAILAGEEIRIFGDGSQRRSNTFVDDAARAAILAGGIQPDATLNIAGRQSIALIDAIGHLEQALGRQATLTFLPAVPGDQTETQGDASLAGELLGWTPEIDILDGLCLQAAAALDRREGSS